MVNSLGPKKLRKFFWRGIPTRRGYNINNIQKLPRVLLVTFSFFYPNLIDAKFTNEGLYEKNQGGQNLEEFINIINRDRGLKYFMTEENHLRYKYLISIDGNVAAWKRVPWIMLSDSVLFLQNKFIQYFYTAIKPWIHYIPLKDDISDIFEKIYWAKMHDVESKKISENATLFTQKCLMPSHIEQDLIFILNEYSKIQKFILSKPTLPPLDSEENLKIILN